jgi:hypothetical protein
MDDDVNDSADDKIDGIDDDESSIREISVCVSVHPLHIVMIVDNGRYGAVGTP